MDSFTVHSGRVACLPRQDVDTDQIIPARFCKRISRTGFEDALFADWRSDPGFVLNQPACSTATILVAGVNFGTGSSREHAVWALRDFGFTCVISTRFGEIFQGNALKNGLLPVVLPESAVAGLFARGEREPGFELTVDLRDCVIRCAEESWPFEVDARAREMILNGLDEIDGALERADRITAHEARRPSWMPLLVRGGTAERLAVAAAGAEVR